MCRGHVCPCYILVISLVLTSCLVLSGLVWSGLPVYLAYRRERLRVHELQRHLVKAAINHIGDDTMKTSIKEVEKLHTRNFLQAINWHELIEEERKSALESLIHIKEKRDVEWQQWSSL